MTPVRSLTIVALVFLVIVAAAADDDCGCSFGWDGPGPSGGWSSGDDPADTGGSSGDSNDAGQSDNSGSNIADNTDGQSGTGDAGGLDSSSSDSGESSISNGGSVEEGLLWRMKGDDLFTKGLYNESLSAYEMAISFDPFSYKSWKGKGEVLLVLGRPEEAASAFIRALKLDPTDAATYALLGDARIVLGDYQAAAEQYLKALAMNPKIEGVSEKLSAAYAAENEVVTMETGTPAGPQVTDISLDTKELPTAGNTGVGMAGDANVSLTRTTKAGFPGAFTGILGFLLVFLVTAFRRK